TVGSILPGMPCSNGLAKSVTIGSRVLSGCSVCRRIGTVGNHRAWLLLVCIMSWPSAAVSLGFGALDMNSFIGEPLAARGTLASVSAVGQGSAQMRMADAAAYERAGCAVARRSA